MANLNLVTVFIAILIQIAPIIATTKLIITQEGEEIQPPVQHFIQTTNGTEFPLLVTEDPLASTTLTEDLTEAPLKSESIVLGGTNGGNSLEPPGGKNSKTDRNNVPEISSTMRTIPMETSNDGPTIVLSISTNNGSEAIITTSTDEYEQDAHGLIPSAKVNASIHLSKPTGEIIFRSDEECPTLIDADSLSQTQLIQRLTAPCRYDRLERPITFNEKGERLPVDVHTRAYVYFMQNLEAHDLQFKMHALLQLRFVDPRLVFKEVAPKRKQPILGEKSLRDTLWVPHIFFANERDSSILGTAEKDILTSISPDGTVIISTRIQATLYCWMNLQKFPFDEQSCSTVLESWMYNTSELVLHWETKSPVTFDPDLHLTEYVLLSSWSNETVVNADLNDLRHGAFAGNYSSLSFTVHLTREVGYYLMDYFLPSMMIVAISWVSFWLQADQSAPRIMLGTSTMLTFITLASAQGKTLPKVSYIKVSEVWFLGCTLFIFGSLVEFAFVNTIWRRKKNVELKKINSKYILKSTLTPRLARKDMGMQKSRSCSSLNDGQSEHSNRESQNYNNYLTVHTLPIITTQCEEDFSGNGNLTRDVEKGSNNNMSKCASISIDDNFVGGNKNNGNSNRSGWTTMTPQEISIWIDRRARFIFPLSFICFNAIFWTFVYCL
ncbi:pH-sensitive chloride channel 2 isoform X1 [Episyrphus balteatus]|uniref:pH-sensitive chloride channel 2 isoform X1 n=1 Tax=Episyrphus balteatus TaxID=286459 RepID=UPI00248554AA|nr:pH-sensitive chloride channel 2 isoform X1 [Episyrphus balteatus]